MDLEKLKALKAKLKTTDTEAGGELPALQDTVIEEATDELVYYPAATVEEAREFMAGSFKFMDKYPLNGQISRIQKVKDKENYKEPKIKNFGTLNIQFDKNELLVSCEQDFKIKYMQDFQHYFYTNLIEKWYNDCGIYIKGTDNFIVYSLICAILSQRKIFPLFCDRPLLEKALEKITADFNSKQSYISEIFDIQDRNVILRRKKIYMLAFESAVKNNKTLNLKKEFV
ncbi:hypothetical protein ACFO4C_004509 [Salmonella enterica]|uniref:hypothetical protein n=1 Tax=Enterobacter chengduensis TaxID=2494701 RepID=UPI00126F4E82|nr:hypothetical protein [Enterobacter chengduensis]ECI2728799.1 hypothetical protein [Salmonella enterica subsp. enterica]ECI4986101.1 hypothetical protein [Salmonella enterica subsp. salamae]EEC0498138.1 hypothetical protein [Salmonella enterica]EHJ5092555.1 hypothetical protein [Salmonella enterica subsp. salamae serovar 16:m,t:-]HBT9007621.1 hypothetical protein [Klebsiella pneumoniae]HBU6955430.1 hypothetical protein [Escherichia coli]